MEQSASTLDSGGIPGPAVHNSVWNFETVCFKVENELFTVFKKGLLVPGSVFLDMFEVPSGPQPVEGKDANSPIVLHGTKASHFSAFLSVLYPWADGGVKLEKQDESTLLGVLRLANMWIFLEIRNQAIAVLSGSSPFKIKDMAEMIQLGEEYFVQQWVLDGYCKLVRKRGLTFGELERDPYHFNQTLVNKILYLKVIHGPGREHTCTGRCGWVCRGYEPNWSDLQTVVKESLRDELARALYVTDDRGSLN